MAAQPDVRSPAPSEPEPLPRLVRWAVLGLLVAFVVIGLVIRLDRNPAVAIAAAIVAVGAAALLLGTRRSLVLPFAVVATAGVAVLGNATSSNVGWFATCVLAAMCVLFGGRREGLAYWVGALALFGGEWVWTNADPGWGAWMAGVTFTTIAGLLVRHELDLVAQLRAAQAGLADRARSEERNRIARELHDVIAHTLTVSLLHVTSARLTVEFDPDDAARALAEAERLGRQSLDEVRGVVGLLRHDDAGTTTAPLPGIAGLPVLIENFRDAGASIALTTEGDVGGLPATTGLGVYRIVQESLTNAAKHAPGARVAITVAVTPDKVEVSVHSAGPAAAGAGAGVGLGLVGMRERAESLGGTCAAGPAGHGWLVRATLPLDRSRRREAAR